MIRAKEPKDSGTLLESVSKKRLVNILNHVNFRGGGVAVNLRNLAGGRSLTLRAAPEPCHGATARLNWRETPPPDIDKAYELIDLLIDRGPRVIVVNGPLVEIDVLGMAVRLPEHCHATSRRRTERFGSAPVHVTLRRNGSEAVGLLQDFGGGFLKVRAAAKDAGFLDKRRSKAPVQIALNSGDAILYEGACTIKRIIAREDSLDLVLGLIPPAGNQTEDNEEAARNPALVVTCRHPLSGKIIRFHVAKASYNSFVVNENPERAVLFPGLIIPETKIDFGAGDTAECTAKVVGGEAGNWSVSITDMPIPDQRKLFCFVEKETGRGSGVSAVIDPDELIEFFFEAGFIYPDKYAALARSLEHLKEILSRLYIDTPSISQHFIEYDGGAIEGHICMVRFYERAWVVQHHTAIGGVGAGSAVLAQIFRYIHNYSALPSTSMDFAMTYYRPENRFPDKVLGGLARSMNTPSLCSIDAFAYLHLNLADQKRCDDGRWQLESSNREDLLELEAFYKGISGGLTLKAFGLVADHNDRETGDLNAEFAKAGLRRQKLFFSLKEGGKLKAIMMALDSDAGLNMSNLMKCIHIFVIDREGLPFDILASQLNKLSYLYEEQEVPILLFPSSYAGEWGVVPEKVYNLLVFHVSVGKRFIEFTERMTNRAVRRRYGAWNSEEGETRAQ